jgi:hypothetical protein
MAAQLGIQSWDHDRRTWVNALVEHPVLIERPILTTTPGDRAILARPPELVVPFATRHQAELEWLTFDSTLSSSLELWGMKQ